MEEMEFGEVRRTLTGFDGVWKRVSAREDHDGKRPESDPPGGGADMTLRSFIGDELALCRVLDRAARMSRDSGERNHLRCLASRARRRADRLRAEVFLRTGDIDETKVPSPDNEDRLRGLRRAMKDAEDLSRDYRAADRDTQDEALSALYRDFAAQTKDAAEELRRMIVACFT